MNFLFLGIFLAFFYFYEFIWIYFELKRIKKYILSRTHVAANVAQAKRGGVATWQRMNMSCGARVCVQACVHACVHVCASVIREIKCPF